jgi:hypothetical protein
MLPHAFVSESATWRHASSVVPALTLIVDRGAD